MTSRKLSFETRFAAVLNARTSNFIELAQLARLDPGSSFRHANLRNVDFTGLDLGGFDFSEADISGCRWDNARIANTRLSPTQLALPELRRAADWAIIESRLETASNMTDINSNSFDIENILSDFARTFNRGWHPKADGSPDSTIMSKFNPIFGNRVLSINIQSAKKLATAKKITHYTRSSVQKNIISGIKETLTLSQVFRKTTNMYFKDASYMSFVRRMFIFSNMKYGINSSQFSDMLNLNKRLINELANLEPLSLIYKTEPKILIIKNSNSTSGVLSDVEETLSKEGAYLHTINSDDIISSIKNANDNKYDLTVIQLISESIDNLDIFSNCRTEANSPLVFITPRFETKIDYIKPQDSWLVFDSAAVEELEFAMIDLLISDASFAEKAATRLPIKEPPRSQIRK